MCTFCGPEFKGELVHCEICKARFEICHGCVQTWQPCRQCHRRACFADMHIPHWCVRCVAAWRWEHPMVHASTQPSLLDPRDPYAEREQVAHYVPPLHVVAMGESDEDDELAFARIDDDSDWYRRRSDNQVFHIKSKGSQTACQVTAAASKLYRLLLGAEHAVLATALEEDPETDEPSVDGSWFVMKPKVLGWMPLASLIVLMDPKPDQTCMVRFPATVQIRQQLASVGQAVDAYGRFGWPQYRLVPGNQRVAQCTDDGVFVDMTGAPRELRGLRELAVAAWFLGESDMHSANFGVEPVGDGAYRVVVVDPSGALNLHNLQLPLTLADHAKLPFTAPAGFEVNGGWHLGGDESFRFAPDVGLPPGQQGATQLGAAVDRIKTTSWQTIAAILDEIDDDTTRDAIKRLLQARHQRLVQLFS